MTEVFPKVRVLQVFPKRGGREGRGRRTVYVPKGGDISFRNANDPVFFETR